MSIVAKPFLKWAGGKTQLLPQIEQQLPQNIMNKPFTYIEPFVGSGAMLFWLLAHFPNMKKAVINDINEDLINCYRTIKNDVGSLIKLLNIWEEEYHSLSSNTISKKNYYYEKRSLFNSRNSSMLLQSALFIFLNRTCFNGLYRVNRNNEFNVPIGSYKAPQICFANNLRAVSHVLQKVTILCGDYVQTAKYVNKNTFFYFDPPYKPISSTSSFTSYTKFNFNDEEQIRLRNFCKKMDNDGHYWILSNSDPSNADVPCLFLEELYADYDIFKAESYRGIGCIAENRGLCSELIIKNT